jgi:MraZ protein
MYSGPKWVIVGPGGRLFLAREVPRFTGQAEHALDDKGRLVVPVRFRERLGPGFILTIAPPDQCLALYPLTTWESVCERLESTPTKNREFRQFVRHLFAHTEEVQCDAQGRLLIAPKLRAYAGIQRDVVTIGTFTRVELWAKERLGEASPSDDEAAAFAAELGLY